MRVVIDGLALRGSNSLAVVLERLLHGWSDLGRDDELHLLVGPEAEVDVPSRVVVEQVPLRGPHYPARMWAQATVLPQRCADLRADALLAILPTTTLRRLSCPRVVIVHDLRHERCPEQFSTGMRVIRRVGHGIGIRQADAVIAVSGRTRDDLLSSRPWLAGGAVSVAHLGGDHVDAWPSAQPGPPYALAFGQWGNKNVGLVLEAWARLQGRAVAPPLVVVGADSATRTGLERRVEELGLAGRVEVRPWLDDRAFRECFASAALVVFPSRFEGFGLPAVEALTLGIPLVITPDPALLEVTDGHAVVMDGWDAEALSTAVLEAQRQTQSQRLDAQQHGRTFTWARTAEQVRRALSAAIAAAGTD